MCQCSEPGCTQKQQWNLKLFFQHCHKATSQELQLVHALGQADLNKDLLPCNIECFYNASKDYKQERNYSG